MSLAKKPLTAIKAGLRVNPAQGRAYKDVRPHRLGCGGLAVGSRAVLRALAEIETGSRASARSAWRRQDG